MNDLDDELTRVFRQHADTLGAAPLAFDDVRGRATSIRRRRRVASGLAVAAAVAVIVPTALVATRGTNSDGPLPATNDPTAIDTAEPTPTTSPVMGDDPGAIDLRGLPTGAEPAVGYERAGSRAGFRQYVVLADGAEVRLERSTVTGPGLGQGSPSESGLAVNAARTAVVWVTPDGTVMAYQDGRAVELGRTALVGAQVEALTGDDCTSDGGCTAWLRGSSGASYEPASSSLTAGGAEQAYRPLVQVRDADDAGLVVGATRILSDGSCSALVDTTTGRQRFETCDYQLDAISPSGEYVLASEPWHSGNLNGTIAVLDARTGEVLASRSATEASMGYYDQAVWEDADHVLYTAYQDGRWSVVRLYVDGAQEFAVAPVEAGDDMARPFAIELQ